MASKVNMIYLLRLGYILLQQHKGRSLVCSLSPAKLQILLDQDVLFEHLFHVLQRCFLSR